MREIFFGEFLSKFTNKWESSPQPHQPLPLDLHRGAGKHGNGKNPCFGCENNRHVESCGALCLWNYVNGNLWRRCRAVPALCPVKDEDKGEAGGCHSGQQNDQLHHRVFASLFLTWLLHHLRLWLVSCSQLCWSLSLLFRCVVSNISQFQMLVHLILWHCFFLVRRICEI